jgi:hypothetical protein
VGLGYFAVISFFAGELLRTAVQWSVLNAIWHASLFVQRPCCRSKFSTMAND